MARVIDNCILLLLGMLPALSIGNLTQNVVALLIAMSVASLGFYLPGKKSQMVIAFVSGVLCIMVPQLAFYLPLVLYQSIIHKAYVGCISAAVYPYVMSTGSYQVQLDILWVATAAAGVWLALRTNRIELLEKEFIHMRDADVELNLVLKERNRNLILNQDNEIHLATLRERNRIAREIHDNVGHLLSRSILQMGALATIYKEEPLHEQLGSVNDTLNHAMNSIRESVHDLHDDSVDLKQAVMEATKTLNGLCHLKVDYDMSPLVPSDVKYCFIATVKEAVSNVARHSNADSVTITLREHPAFFQLTIEDNGTKLPSSLDGGIGLLNMKDRVEALHGTLRIHMDGGFKIFISLKKEKTA